MPKWLFPLLFAATLILAAYFRFTGLNWDQDQHLHPDERFLTMVTTDLKWPTSFSEFINTSISPLNPHNKNYNFYVYGTFPVFVTKLVSDLLHMDDYGHLVLVGRFLSALLDMGVCLLVYLISYQITHRKYLSLVPLFLYSCLITPIQLAHFYATDTWVTFFTVLSFYLVIHLHPWGESSPHPRGDSYRGWIIAAVLGISLGLLAASKISGLLFLPIISLALLPIRKFLSLNRFLAYLLIIIFTFVTVRLAQPYLFTGPGFFNLALNPKLIANWKELATWSKPENAPPFAYQWIVTKPVIYDGLQVIFWGLGLPFSVLTLITLISQVTFFKKFTHPAIWLSLLWVLALFGYESIQFAKALRYLYPMMPFLAILVGIGVGKMPAQFRFRNIRYTTYCILGCLILWNAFAFMSIYAYPHTRVQASTWIYQHIPQGSTITTEVWDDGLPLTLSATENSSRYTSLALPLYDPDTPEKWAKLSQQLASADYLILSSNRLWRSISSLPQKYPISAPFYNQLLNNQLGFQTEAVFSSYPCLIPRLSPQYTAYNILHTNVVPPVFSLVKTSYCTLALNDDGAEESFTVYDHPKVIILKNVSHLKANEIYNLTYGR